MTETAKPGEAVALVDDPASKVAWLDEIARKHGNPNGTLYQQGVWDMAMRLKSKILVSSPPTADKAEMRSERILPAAPEETPPDMGSREELALAVRYFGNGDEKSPPAQRWRTDARPLDGSPFYVRVADVYRFCAYKPNSQQARAGIAGRWQTMNEYGAWENCAEPVGEWCLDFDGGGSGSGAEKGKGK